MALAEPVRWKDHTVACSSNKVNQGNQDLQF